MDRPSTKRRRHRVRVRLDYRLALVPKLPKVDCNLATWGQPCHLPGDTVNGWDMDILRKALNDPGCVTINKSIEIQKCPVLALAQASRPATFWPLVTVGLEDGQRRLVKFALHLLGIWMVGVLQ
jgi:hypothetical protein